nr:transposase [Gilliamella apicola]
MIMKLQSYPTEFKRDAASLVVEQGYCSGQVN